MRILLIALSIALAVPSVGSALDNDEILSLVAMPLAVAAVAELIDVPHTDLLTLVTALNDASVPPAQFVEVVRWSPVVLVDTTAAPQFIQLVTTDVTNGVRGDAFAVVVADRLRASGAEIDVTAPRLVRLVDRDVVIIPTRVNDRVAAVRRHPHGGPPGQLKKELGLQTGAEVVHGAKPGRGNDGVGRVVTRTDDDRPGTSVDRGETRPNSTRVNQPPGQQKKQNAQDRGKGKGKEKGKGRR